MCNGHYLIERIGPDGRYLYVNDAWCVRHGYSREEALALRIWDVDKSTAEDEWHAKWTRRKELGLAGESVWHRAKDGEVFPAQVEVLHMNVEGQDCDFFLLRDITEHEAPRSRPRFTRHVGNDTQDAVLCIDRNSRVVFVSDAVSSQLGYSREELLTFDIYDIYPETPRPWEIHWRRLAGIGSLTYATFGRRKDGTEFPVEVSVNYIEHNHQGYILVFPHTVMESEQAEREHRQLVNELRDGVFVIDSTGRFIMVNECVVQALGYPEHELLSMKVHDIDIHLSAEEIRELIRRNQRGETLLFETAHKTRDGSVLPVEIKSSTIFYRGEPATLAVARGLRERKQAEQDLRDEILRRRILINGSSDGIVVLDPQGRVREVNRQFAHMLGYSTEEVMGLRIWDWDVTYGKEELLTLLDALDDKGDRCKSLFRTKDGSTIEVETSANAPVIGGEKHVFLICRDVTQRNRMERAIIEEKERLSLLNTVAVTMSHCLTASDVLRTGIRLACKTTGHDGAIIRAISPEGRSRTMASAGLTQRERAQLAKLMPRAEMLKRITKGQASIRFGESEIAQGRSSSEPIFANALLVPLVGRGETLGALCLATRKKRPSTVKQDVGLAEAIAAMIGAALKNAFLYDHSRFLAQRDPVTGLLNSREIGICLEKELARNERSGGCLSLIVMDLDNFKQFNDTYGHAYGDRVLKDVSAALTRSIRQVDTLGRYGGDEFVVLLPDTDASGALAVSQRIRMNLRELGYGPDNGAIPVFVSFGVATYPLDGLRPSELLAVADANLYRSKHRGGNCITTSAEGHSNWEQTEGGFTVLEGLVTAVDGKDRYTRKHSDDVSELVVAIAHELGHSLETQRSLRIAALLHDVGKIAVPDHILRKPGRLTDEEFAIVKQHVHMGEIIIKEIPDLAEVIEAIRTHHERWDGRGYPQGLKGENIPLTGRILAVADTYSAMTSDRPYRKALTRQQARAELERVSGTQLDPQIVRVLLTILDHASVSPTHKPTELTPVACPRSSRANMP